MSMINPVSDVITFPILSCRNLVHCCENLSVHITIISKPLYVACVLVFVTVKPVCQILSTFVRFIRNKQKKKCE